MSIRTQQHLLLVTLAASTALLVSCSAGNSTVTNNVTGGGNVTTTSTGGGFSPSTEVDANVDAGDVACAVAPGPNCIE